MIGTLLRIGWLNLKRDRIALGLGFVLPLFFFSIFALVFGSAMGGGGTGGGPGTLAVIVVDEDGTEVSRRFAESIAEQQALTVVTSRGPTEADPQPAPFTRETARREVRGGRRDAAVVIPPGFADSFGTLGSETPTLELIHDAANPIAAPTLSGLLQASAMMAAPDVLLSRGVGQLETFGEPLTPKQRAAMDSFLPRLRGERAPAGPNPEPPTDAQGPLAGFNGLVTVATTEARAEDATGAAARKPKSMSAYYAAGVGVMFLLFSMTAAGGSLLDEQESGTLERLLSSDLDMGTLLLGKWLFFALVGALQLTLMFVWGALAFGLELFTPHHLAGFAAMTLVTAAAAAAFGIVLATACRSRAQLGGVSTIVVLAMSALGGSMMPKFLAKKLFALTSPFTLNGWALDGYLKVFWYDEAGESIPALLARLWPQLLMLGAMAIAFLGLARRLARRWEAA